MTAQDLVLMAITAYRENRGGGLSGMQSVINVVMNRVKSTGESPYLVCTTHAQFSSISMPGPESYLWPKDTDPDWTATLAMAAEAAAGTLVDLTDSATLYYAPAAIETTVHFVLPGGRSVPFPKGWNVQAVKFTVAIADQLFFTEN